MLFPVAGACTVRKETYYCSGLRALGMQNNLLGRSLYPYTWHDPPPVLLGHLRTVVCKVMFRLVSAEVLTGPEMGSYVRTQLTEDRNAIVNLCSVASSGWEEKHKLRDRYAACGFRLGWVSNQRLIHERPLIVLLAPGRLSTRAAAAMTSLRQGKKPKDVAQAATVSKPG